MAWLLNLPPGVILEQLLVLVGALVATALATRVVCKLSVRWDFVSRPSGDRWAARVVPMGGGIAMVIPLALGLGFVSYDLLAGALLMFGLGLVDDRRSVAPPVKLVLQTVAACWMVAGPLDPGGPALLFHGPDVIVLPLTVGWYVGVTNSLNLLDNMDGSAVGVAGIAASFIFVLAVGGQTPDPSLAAAAACFVGVAGGFLIFNFPPAKIFMGDAGSLLLGFTLAGLALHLPGSADAPLKEFSVAAFVLGIPLFDTALVWFSRRAARRPFLQGGKDHTTHRLVALGLSERRTVIVLYGVAAALGGIGLAVARGGLGTAVITAVVGGIVLVLLGIFLGDVPVYDAADGTPPVPSLRSPALLYGVELAVDVGILSAAWLGAYAIRFDEALSFYLLASAIPALPFVIAIKVSVLLFFNLYRGFWRTIGFKDAIAVAKAVCCASLLIVVAGAVIQRFEDYSIGVILIDLLLSFVAVLGSRSALRVLRDSMPGWAGRERKAALYGPETLKPLLDATLQSAHYEWVGAVPVGDPDAVVAAIRALEAEVVVVGVPSAPDDPVLRALEDAGLQLRRLEIQLD